MIPRNRKMIRFRFIAGFLIACLSVLACPLHAMPPVQRMVLPNHLLLLVSEDHSLPFVTMQLLVDSGSRRDPPEQEGLAYLTSRGLLLGTAKHTVVQMNEELDFIGAVLNASSGRDYATVSLRVLKKDLDKGLDLLIEAMTQPTFPEDEIRREIEKTLARIQSAEDQPGEVAEKEFQKALFLKNPYGHPVEGTKESIPRLKREDLLQFFKTYYHPNNIILTLVGDMTPEEVKAKILPRLEKWPANEIPKESLDITLAKEPKTIRIDRAITQANIILGHAGVSRGNPDYYAISVMNYILGGGGFASRLTEEIRNKRGLAYAVESYFDPGKYPGAFQIVLQTKNASAREAISLAIEQMDRIRKEPVSEKELEGAQKYLIGSFPTRFDTQAKLANFLTQIEYYGLGLDYPQKYPSLIRAITREEILRDAKTYLHPENLILVIVGDLKEAGLE
ncbi:MAG TPA: pitrilysin family protein [Thermodesulfobacteriota bacterium]|nr:pitrilysin family protein [Thermodesulfobacteriota bacterium]